MLLTLRLLRSSWSCSVGGWGRTDLQFNSVFTHQHSITVAADGIFTTVFQPHFLELHTVVLNHESPCYSFAVFGEDAFSQWRLRFHSEVHNGRFTNSSFQEAIFKVVFTPPLILGLCYRNNIIIMLKHEKSYSV